MKGNRGNRTPVHRRTFHVPTLGYDRQHWSSGTPFPLTRLAPTEKPTAFEEFVASLHVPEQYWHQDRRIVHWVHAHKNYHYVPEELLHKLGEKVLMDGWEI